jgi:hypothetical protein
MARPGISAYAAKRRALPRLGELECERSQSDACSPRSARF